MGTIELFRHLEKGAWDTFRASGSSADLRAWLKALTRLHDEIQHRVKLLRTSAP